MTKGLPTAGGTELGEGFYFFHPVVDDGAVGGAVNQFPHAAFERSSAFEEVGETLAVARAGFVDGAFVAY